MFKHFRRNDVAFQCYLITTINLVLLELIKEIKHRDYAQELKVASV